jgi:hypothetical protein
MLLERMIRAARLDSSLFEEVEADLNATSQAATVVGIVAICSAFGGAVRFGTGAGGSVGGAVTAFIGGLILAFIGWIAWSYITYWIGTSIFKGQATPGELLRTIGFAQTPGILNILQFVPFLGGLVSLVVFFWSIIAGVIALRQALDISTGQAVITAVIGFIPMLVIYCLMGLIIGGGSFAMGQ